MSTHNIRFRGKHTVSMHNKRLAKALLMSTHHTFSWRNKENIYTFWLEKSLN